MRKSSSATSAPRHVVIVGLGNIGSSLTGLLAHVPGVQQITLIDRDHYTNANLATQAIAVREVGKPKAVVQARRLQQLNPQLAVNARVTDVEQIPWGQLRADVILAAVDSRRARLCINQIAWRLGVPWIDAGVKGDELLVRLNVYVPHDDAPCLECSYDERDYAAVETAYPCLGNVIPVASTNAPASLGALAAALQATECQKLLTGQNEHALIGQQVLLDVLHHRHFRTTFRRRRDCRFDHRVWPITPLTVSCKKVTLGQLWERVRTDHEEVWLRVGTQHFITRLTCTTCGNSKPLLRLERAVRTNNLRCAHCRQQTLVSAAFDRDEQINLARVAPGVLNQSLRHCGLVAQDIITITSRTGEQHFEITDDRL